jgi:hypothetical protein
MVIIAAIIISIINIIWLSRNNLRYVKPVWNSVIAWIVANANMTGNQTSLTTSSSITDFPMLNFFNVRTHFPKAPLGGSLAPSSAWLG